MLLAEKISTDVEIQRRANSRVAYREPCFVQSDSRSLWVKAINLTEGGMCVAVEEFGALKRGTKIAVFLQNFTDIDAVVRWTRGNVAGLEFRTPIADHPELASLLQRLRGGKPAWPLKVHSKIDDKLPASVRDILGSADKALPEQQVQSKTDPAKQRAHERIDFPETCLIRTDKRTFQAKGINLSVGGMCLRLLGLGKMRIGTSVQVVLPGGYPPIDAILRWEKDRVLCLQFSTPIKGHPVIRAISEPEDT